MVKPMNINTLLGIQPLGGMGGTFGGFTLPSPQPQFGHNFGQYNPFFTNTGTSYIPGQTNANMNQWASNSLRS